MTEADSRPFSTFIVPMFEHQERHKVLLVTKSAYTKNLEKIEEHKQTIVSFSLNAQAVSEKWEMAPPIKMRIEAAYNLYRCGYAVRVRIDPIVPIENWRNHYLDLLRIIFDKFTPERITFGSLRGLQSTINNASDKSWVSFLTENSNWGKKVSFELRYLLYGEIINYLREQYNFSRVALCKETIGMWQKLGMDYRKIRCNCLL
jgi:spore photoproduct lyase